MQPILKNMVNAIDMQIAGLTKKPILEGFTDMELNTIRAFVVSFDHPVMYDRVVIPKVENPN